MLLNDGCTGIAVLNPGIPQEVQFDEHKLLIVYGDDLAGFEQVFAAAGSALRRSNAFHHRSRARPLVERYLRPAVRGAANPAGDGRRVYVSRGQGQGTGDSRKSRRGEGERGRRGDSPKTIAGGSPFFPFSPSPLLDFPLLVCPSPFWHITCFASRSSKCSRSSNKVEVWPAIDLRGGRCVRLQQGDYGRETVFGDDPAAAARYWVDHGARRLHLVDLDGPGPDGRRILPAFGRSSRRPAYPAS